MATGGDTTRPYGFSASTEAPPDPHTPGQAGDQQPQGHPQETNTPQHPVLLSYPQPQGGPLGLTLSFDMGALLRTQVGCVKIMEFVSTRPPHKIFAASYWRCWFVLF